MPLHTETVEAAHFNQLDGMENWIETTQGGS